jgi:hypothetical protein
LFNENLFLLKSCNIIGDLLLQKNGKSKILVAFLSMAFLGSFLIELGNASITREYEYDQIGWDGNLWFRFKIKAIIETEEDGTWIPSNWYGIDYIITLEYINRSITESLVFYDAHLVGAWVTNRALLAVVNSTEIMRWSGQTGKLSFEASENPVGFDPRCRNSPWLRFNYTFSESFGYGTQPISAWWQGEEHIYIGKTSQGLEQSSVVVVSIIVGVAIGVGFVLIGIRIGEKRAEKKTVKP